MLFCTAALACALAARPSAAQICTPEWNTGNFGVPGTTGTINAFLIHDDGINGAQLYASGIFTSIGGVGTGSIARWDGAHWNPLGPGLSSRVTGLATFDDGTGPALYASGNFTTVGGTSMAAIARWDGQSWAPLGAGLTRNIGAAAGFTLAAFEDGLAPLGRSIYVGGYFEFAGGQPAINIARWDGQNWHSLGDASGTVNCLFVWNDGTGQNLYAGGNLLTIGGVAANGIARYDGSSWTALGGGVTGAFGRVNAMTLHVDGSEQALYIGGSFSHAGGVPAASIAKWNGFAWSALTGGGISGGSSTIGCVEVFDDGHGPVLFVGGSFSHAGGMPASGIAKWTPTGWSTIANGPGHPVNPVVSALLWVQANPALDAALYVGGSFNEVAGSQAGSLTRYECMGTQATVSGSVRDLQSGAPVGEATVSIFGHSPVQTNPQGQFSVVGAAPGLRTLQVTAPGYYSIEQLVLVGTASHSHVALLLPPHNMSVYPMVVRVAGAFCGPDRRGYYLDGVSVNETFTATIDWRGHTPGQVQFITPMGTFPAQGTGNTWTRTLNMGTDVGLRGTVQVQAIAAGGSPTSAQHAANLRVVEPPQGLSASLLAPDTSGSTLVYRLLGWHFAISEGVGQGVVPSFIPFFGGAEMKLGIPIAGNASVRSDGTARMDLSTAWSSSVTSTVLGAGFHPSVTGALNWNYSESQERWMSDGEVGAHFEVALTTAPAYFMFVPVPVYWQLAMKIGLGTSIGLHSWSASGWPQWAPGPIELAPYPYVEGVIGVGGANVVATEGYIGGGARMRFDFANTPHFNRLQLFLTGGVRVVFGIFRWTFPVEYGWELLRGGGPVIGEFGLLERDYLKDSRTYAEFVANAGLSRYGRSPQTIETPIQTNVFNYSTPALAAIGDDLLMVWVYDEPMRTPTNRTMLVYSVYDDAAGTWSTPLPVADDGTADFRPRLAGLPSGDALLVWENVKEVLAEPANPNDPVQLAAKYEEMKSKTEIAVARFNRTTGWTGQHVLTDDLVMDAAPRLSAASDGTAMVAWVSNTANNEIGSAAEPNVVRYAFYDGENWGTATNVAAGGAILRSELAYAHGEAIFIYATDVDDDLSTSGDRQLVTISYAAGAWGAPVQVTNNTVEDAGPQIIPAGNGWLIAWFQDDSIVFSADLFQNVDAVVEFDGPSSGAADFRMATDNTGRIALIWQEPSEDVVDLWYATYDPVVQAWAAPQRLTASVALEYGLSAAFTRSGDLVAAFNRAELTYQPRIVELPSGPVQVEVPVPGIVDLYLLRRIVAGDLAGEAILLDPPNPHPGQQVDAAAVVLNMGDNAVTDVDVDLYDGPPTQGGALIGRGRVQGLLLPGTRGAAMVSWTTPALIPSPLTVYAVVDPDLVHNDFDRNNNTATLAGVMRPDLIVDSMLAQNAGPQDRIITTRVRNIGGTAVVQAFEITLRKDGPAGQVIATVPVSAAVVSGAYVDVPWVWNNASPFQEGSQVVWATIDEAGVLNEFSFENNTGQVLAVNSPPEPPSCYPNCDASTIPPILNVDDFTCFINAFAAGQALPHEQQLSHYANCDQSTIAPVLNVDDFTCFINAFALGCP